MRTIDALLACALLAPGIRLQDSGPLKICATTSDLASIVAEVGGDDVRVACFSKGTEDPHFVEIRPSHVRDLHAADLLVLNGLDLESGWLPALVNKARNPRVRSGQAGRLDASEGIRALGRPTAVMDRSQGDVHPDGNPHYLLDPIHGLRVAGRLRARLAELRPTAAARFKARHEAFRARLGAALIGERLCAAYPFEKLAVLAERDRLLPFLDERQQRELLGGWLGALLPHRGTLVVSEHDLYPYFAHRFGLEIVGLLEPKAGVPPTTKQLAAIAELIRAKEVALILTVSYYDPRHAEIVARGTGARIVKLAHQVGARRGDQDYVATIDGNVRAIVEATARRGDEK